MFEHYDILRHLVNKYQTSWKHISQMWCKRCFIITWEMGHKMAWLKPTISVSFGMKTVIQALEKLIVQNGISMRSQLTYIKRPSSSSKKPRKGKEDPWLPGSHAWACQLSEQRTLWLSAVWTARGVSSSCLRAAPRAPAASSSAAHWPCNKVVRVRWSRE